MLPFCLLLFVLTAICEEEDNERYRVEISERSLDIRGYVGQRFEVMFELPDSGYNTIVTSGGRTPIESDDCSTHLFNCTFNTDYMKPRITLNGVFSKDLLFAYIEGPHLLPVTVYFFVNHRWTEIPGNPFYVPISTPFYINPGDETEVEFMCSLEAYQNEFKLYADISPKLIYHVDSEGTVIVDKRDEFKSQIVSIRMLNDEILNLVTFAVKVKPRDGIVDTNRYACNSGDSWIYLEVDYLAIAPARRIFPPLTYTSETAIPSPLQLSVDVRGPAGSKFFSTIPLPGDYTIMSSSGSSTRIGSNPNEGYLFEANISRVEPRTATIEGYIARGLKYIYFTGRKVIPMTIYFSADFRWPVFTGENFMAEETLPMVIGGKGRTEVTVSWKINGLHYTKFVLTGRATNELIYKKDGKIKNLSHKFPEVTQLNIKYSGKQARIYFNATKHEDVDYYCLRVEHKYLTHIVDWNAPETPVSVMPSFVTQEEDQRFGDVNYPMAPTIGDTIHKESQDAE